MSTSSTGRQSDRKDGFIFVGNQLALDFVNTRLVQNGQPIELLPNFAALLRWFHAAGLLNSGQVAALRQEWDGSKRARGIAEAMRLFSRFWSSFFICWRCVPCAPA